MNELEKSIIQFIFSSYPDDFKNNCISKLVVSEREYTGAGVIVCFEKRGNVVTNSKAVNFIGPLIESSALELGAETVLSVNNGHLDCLDILVRGCGDIKAVTSYRLIDETLISCVIQAHNKLFKSDSARVAFLLCVGFSG